ncbi:NADH dehydrogenase [ubiquinone] 1 beta subcomplex subunit 7 [Vespula pensylvanica]|uniref:NADH dehydrogenase [ubiquinone] 1 beta subcomplex subunit 7 n=1 Tax=Vespula pensylvanica TaxID=30213 RepID=UPI001CB9F134|nr:NADH dehydrogenase [ubiquinone] 1 beta subcomplex subunit 7 [Vespula pensylvanica]
MVVFSSVSLKSSFSQTKMGTLWSSYVTHPDITPEAETAPTFDPLYGFQNGRKARVMIATDAEMKAARIPKRFRDYCAHKFLELEDCRKYHFPMMNKCDHQNHAYQQCQYEDYVLRMKEFERERRLLERQKRKQQAAAA